jgi:hypothetical protein
MPYEVFERKISRMGTPAMSFSKIGTMAFNQFAARILQKASVEFLLILWDSEERKLAIKTTKDSKDSRAYHLHYNDKGNGASFSCKTFLDFAGINYMERKTIPVELNLGGPILLEVKLPDEIFTKHLPHQQQLAGGLVT